MSQLFGTLYAAYSIFSLPKKATNLLFAKVLSQHALLLKSKYAQVTEWTLIQL